MQRAGIENRSLLHKQLEDQENDCNENKNMKPKQKINTEQWSWVDLGNLGTGVLNYDIKMWKSDNL